MKNPTIDISSSSITSSLNEPLIMKMNNDISSKSKADQVSSQSHRSSARKSNPACRSSKKSSTRCTSSSNIDSSQESEFWRKSDLRFNAASERVLAKIDNMKSTSKAKCENKRTNSGASVRW